MEKNNNKRNVILAAICGVAFLACVAWLVCYFINVNRTEQEMNQLKDQYVTEQPDVTKDVTAETVETKDSDEEEANEPQSRVVDSLEGFEGADKVVDFDALKEQNEDIYSWITIPGTVIDYPIVQDPDELDYYLDHNLDHSKGYPGCIYTQNMNSTDWEDNHTVIYGHNMKNGTMFAGLHGYRDPEFFASNPYVYIFAPDETRVYQIFAAYEVSDAHLLLTYNTEDQDSLGWYLDGVMENEESISDHFDKSLGLNSTDKIISLETCISTKPTMRYLVQAVLIAKVER